MNRQKIIPILTIVTLHAVLVGASASFNLRPNLERRLGPIFFGCMLGLFSSILAMPAIMRWKRRAKGKPLFPEGILLRLPLVLLCLNYLCVYLFGYESWLRDGPIRHISNFLIFAMFPWAYHVYYSRLPVGSRGVWLGIAMTLEITAWHAVSGAAMRMGAVTPGATHPMLPYVYLGLFPCLVGMAALLAYALIFRDEGIGDEPLSPDKIVPPDMAEKPARGRIALVLAATICIHAVTGIVNATLPPSLTITVYPASPAWMEFIVLALVPLAGWWLDRRPVPAFRTLGLVCGGIFIFSPAVTVLGDSPGALWCVLTLMKMAQYVAMLSFSLALGGFVRPEDGIRRWPAVLFATRPAMEACFLLFRVKYAISLGLGVLLSTAFAFAFLVLTYLLSRPEAAATAQDADDDFDVFLADRDLTGRQREVAVLLLRGATTRDIAETLGIAEPTVKIHVRKTLDKFGCPTRKAFLSVYSETGGERT